jgi:hypothetical protein
MKNIRNATEFSRIFDEQIDHIFTASKKIEEDRRS